MVIQSCSKLLGYGAVLLMLASCGTTTTGVDALPPDDGGGDTGGGDSGGGDMGGGDTGGGDPPAPTSPFNLVTAEESAYFQGAFQDDFAFVRDTARVGGTATLADLPGSGVVSYDGFMAISFFSSLAANIRGEATLTVDMATGATGGGATGFMGAVFDETTMTSPIVHYEGDITFSGGSLTAGSNGAAALDIQIDGAFNNGVQDLSITGHIDGYVYGPGGEGVFASGSNFIAPKDITTVVDGTEVNGVATLWALKQ